MPRAVIVIITTGRDHTIDNSAGDAYSVVNKNFSCIKIALERVGNTFGRVLVIFATIQKPSLGQR